MSYTFTHDPDDNLIHCRAQGTFTHAEPHHLMAEAVQLLRRHDCRRLLIDFRAATLPFTTPELYSLPQIFAELAVAAGLPAGAIKRAFVRAEARADFAFLETVAVNRGQRVRVFADEAEARAWLVQP